MRGIVTVYLSVCSFKKRVTSKICELFCVLFVNNVKSKMCSFKPFVFFDLVWSRCFCWNFCCLRVLSFIYLFLSSTYELHILCDYSAECLDKVDCRLYGQSACSGSYEHWAKDNCPNFCGFCRGNVLTGLCHCPVCFCNSHDVTLCSWFGSKYQLTNCFCRGNVKTGLCHCPLWLLLR